MDALSAVQKRTIHFYEWERRGRGWYVFTTPVELEPVFVPFFPYRDSSAFVDEGLRPNILQRNAFWHS